MIACRRISCSVCLVVSALIFAVLAASQLPLSAQTESVSSDIKAPAPAVSADTPAVETESVDETDDPKKKTILQRINGALEKALFFDIAFKRVNIPEVNAAREPVLDDDGVQKSKNVSVPFLVIFLLLGGIFFTLWYRWINVRGFKHSVEVIQGKYDRPEDPGEISHFRALTSALSATIGLGNIAGVAVAIQLGGPGAVLWMWITAVFAMTAKFSSCTLSQLYRTVNSDGSISGGPMYYLDLGMRSMGPVWGVVGKILAVMFAIMVMGGAIGGGNMFQANQTAEAFSDAFHIADSVTMNKSEYEQFVAEHVQHAQTLNEVMHSDQERVTLLLKDLSVDQRIELGDTFNELKRKATATARWGIGLALAVCVGVVILGGIKRIGAATSRIVPAMCGLYVIGCLFVIMTHFKEIPATFGTIFRMAFTQNAFYGGLAGVMVMGIKRAVFSNEGGLGSAAIAHAAAKTDEPVREGIVAMVGPFIDTIVVCTMTALVVVITGTWDNEEIIQQGGNIGVTLTTEAFRQAVSWFPYVLSGCIALFAYSTMISWCYYGERGWIYLLDHVGSSGLKTVMIFRVIFVAAIVWGAVEPLGDVITFSDFMILSMAFPNIIGSIILAPIVLKKVKNYWGRYTSGEMKPIR